MAKKETRKTRETKHRPRSAEEVPLQKGYYVWVESNPPEYPAFVCECHRSDCETLLWGGSLAVRDHKGAYLSLTCALRAGITSRDEVKQKFPELLRLRQGDKQVAPAPEPPAPEPPAPEPPASESPASELRTSRATRKRREKPAPEPPAAPEPTAPEPKEVPAECPASEPKRRRKTQGDKPKLPQSMSPKLKESLAADALANAPPHVRERLARRNGC